ncbi:MAG: RNA polymerase factor sigma-54 [Pikeienuella sp.]
MSFAQRLELKQSQQLVMTPQLQQAIKLLQMSAMDVGAFVADEVERNPLLSINDGGGEQAAPVAERPSAAGADHDMGDIGKVETAFDGASGAAANLYEGAEAAVPVTTLNSGGDTHFSWAGTGGGGAMGEATGFEDRLAEEVTLRDHLLPQIAMAQAPASVVMLASLLVDEVDGAGYLRADTTALQSKLAVPDDVMAAAIALLQSCDPAGIGARDLSECLALQLQEQNRFDPAMAALLANLNDLAAARFDRLEAACGVEMDDIREMAQEIRALDPRPGARFSSGVAQTVIPDVFVRRNQLGGWSVEMNADALPKVLIDTRYAAELNAQGHEETRTFVEAAKQSATWLTRALDQRAQTIMKVTSEIIRRQASFFQMGVSGLKPMTLRDVAAEINMHESTVSRVTANKYMATERGVFELKFFFTQAISASDGGDSHSSEAVRSQIKALIGHEDSRKPLSDDQIVKILTKSGVNLARRTVAKYRESMDIPSSVQRKRLAAAALRA